MGWPLCVSTKLVQRSVNTKEGMQGAGCNDGKLHILIFNSRGAWGKVGGGRGQGKGGNVSHVPSSLIKL